MSLPSNRNGKIEERQHFRAHIADEHITDDGRRYRTVTGLADAHKTPHHQKHPEIVHERAQQRRQTPDENPRRHNRPKSQSYQQKWVNIWVLHVIKSKKIEFLR